MFLRFLKYISVFAVFLIFLPCYLLLCALIADRIDMQMIVGFLIIPAVGFFGYFISYLARNKSGLMSKLYLFISAPFVLGLCLITAPSSTYFLLNIALTILSLVSYCLGAYYYSVSYAYLLSSKCFYLSCAIHVFVIALSWFIYKNEIISVDISYFIAVLIPSFFMFTFIFAVNRNQGNIDYLMLRRKHNMKQLPKSIRNYNLILICTVFTTLIILYLFRDLIIKGLLFFKDIIFLLFRFFFYVLDLLLSLIPISESSGSDGSGSAPMLPMEQGTDNPDYTMLIVTIAAIILLIINAKRLYRLFSNLLKWIKVRILIIFDFFKRKNTPIQSFGEQEEYSDEIIELAHDVSNKQKTQKSSPKKLYRHFLSLRDDTERLLFGYALVVKHLKDNGGELHHSDTPDEILNKVRSKKIPLDILTAAYNGVKYGQNKATPGDIEAIKDCLKNK